MVSIVRHPAHRRRARRRLPRDVRDRLAKALTAYKDQIKGEVEFDAAIQEYNRVEVAEADALAQRLGLDPEYYEAERGETRPVEVAYGFYENHASRWLTEYVDVPLDTPEDQIEAKAREAFLDTHRTLVVAFVTLYHLPQITEE